MATEGGRHEENAYPEAVFAISARSQYALRAMFALAREQREGAGPLSVETIASQHHMPRRFLEKVIGDLRRAGLVVSKRGAHGGYTLARPASDVSLGDIIGAAPRRASTTAGRLVPAGQDDDLLQHLPAIWHSVGASLRRLLDDVTLDDAMNGRLEVVTRRAPDAS